MSDDGITFFYIIFLILAIFAFAVVVVELKRPSKNVEKKIERNKAVNLSDLKDKIVGFLGGAGSILYYLLLLIISIMPLVMIGTNWWQSLIIIAADQFLPVISSVFWVWGLIKAILGPQNVFAIIYYVLFAIVYIPFFITFIASFRGKE